MEFVMTVVFLHEEFLLNVKYVPKLGRIFLQIQKDFVRVIVNGMLNRQVLLSWPRMVGADSEVI
jgi:hypothetical protein